MLGLKNLFKVRVNRLFLESSLCRRPLLSGKDEHQERAHY